MSALPEHPPVGTDALCRALSLRDLSDPAQGPHAIQLLLDDVVDALLHKGFLPPATHRVVRDGPLVPVEDNYDRLGYEPDAVTRDSRYSRYVSASVMLRSHTSAAIPSALRRYRDTIHDGGTLDELLVVPGLVHRRDAVDRTHVGEPHQVDLWRIRSAPDTTPDDLEAMVAAVVEAVLPGATWRTVPAVHPYTTHGRQVDVRTADGWLELAECGLAAPHVLARAGLDPDRWSGLALGMGLDRALMLRKGIDDVRVLRAADPRVAVQMLDLAPWRPVSRMPAVRRDLSLVLDRDGAVDDETLGDAVRQALGADADDVESVSLLAVTPHEGLPPAARGRLGTRPGQVNALVRMVLRPVTRTLDDAEANALRNRVYLALHRGPYQELA